MNGELDLTSDQYRRVLDLLNQHLPDTDVWAYGSRVNWTSRPQSDLDLVVFSGLDQSGQVCDLREALEESDLPFRTDVLVWNALPESFREEIDRSHVALIDTGDAKLHGPWPEVLIGDVTTIHGGSTPSTKDPSNFDGDIPWLTPKDLSLPHYRYVSRGGRNISPRGLASCSARLVPAGTVLLSTRAPIGYVAIAACPMATNQGFRNLIPSSDLLSEYLYYWLMANVSELKRHAAGSTFAELSGRALRQIGIPIPPLGVQRRLVHTMGTLDDKIELNRRMIGVLDQIICAMYRDWFVRFGPVRARAMRKEPYLPIDVWSQFSSTFAKSQQLGNIPRGWHVCTLGEVMRIHKRTAHPSQESKQMVEHYSIPAFDRHGEPMIESECNIKSAKNVIPPQSVVLLSKLNPNKPRVWIPNCRTTRRRLASTEFLVCEPTSGLGQGVLYCLFKSITFQNAMQGMVTGTSRSHQRVSPSTLLSLPVIVAPQKVQGQFDRLSRPLVARMLTIRKEAATLRRMARLLRQHYMSV